MNSRERLQFAISHIEPDRIPLDIGSTKMSGISLTAYRNFLNYKGWTDCIEEDMLLDAIQQLARVSEKALDRIKVDTRGVFPAPPLKAPNKNLPLTRPADPRYRRMVDEWGIGWQIPLDNGLYYDLFSSPMEGDPDYDIQTGYVWPDGADAGRFSGMEKQIGRFFRMDAGLVMHGFTSGMFEMHQRLRGYENALVDLITDVESAGRILDRIVEAKMMYWEKALNLSSGRVQVAVEVDDLGTQHSLLLSRELYRRILFPRHQKLFRFIHAESPGIKVFMHSCGAISEVIPDLIEAGVDILNPVQTSAAGMDPVQLKKNFGKDLVFWGGGVDTQHVLPHGSPQQVRDDVRRSIDALAPGGGFVFNTIHNIQADVPPENLDAMLEAVEQYGKY
ncbi:MAG: uroporphyrinogen decarboxylase family protein [Saccharofermentanales bacterium]